MKPVNPTVFKCARALVATIIFAATAAQAALPSPSVLAAQWWQWVMAIPVSTSPLFDTTGEFAQIGQSGPVWFLAGTFGGTNSRTFTVPAGKPLFFPVANQAYFADTPGFWGNPPPKPLAAARDACKAALEQVTEMACVIDGVSVPITEDLREQSVPFAVRLAEDNVFGLVPPHLTVPGCVDEGYYVLLPPLSPGQHTIYIHAANPTTGWTLDVTDHITVQ
jgi:hypothetical protein